jgi:hypothetical protein
MAMTDINDRITREFGQNLNAVLDLSHRINADPEPAFQEHRASASIVATLDGRGAFSKETAVP